MVWRTVWDTGIRHGRWLRTLSLHFSECTEDFTIRFVIQVLRLNSDTNVDIYCILVFDQCLWAAFYRDYFFCQQHTRTRSHPQNKQKQTHTKISQSRSILFFSALVSLRNPHPRSSFSPPLNTKWQGKSSRNSVTTFGNLMDCVWLLNNLQTPIKILAFRLIPG